MRRVLVSACLLGQRVRYDGAAASVSSEILDRWIKDGRIVSFCPEVAGGFPVPRPAAEIIGAGGEAVLRDEGKVVDESGSDVTNYFIRGAQQTLDTALVEGLRVAVLKDGSPSCGSTFIHDGSFSGATQAGVGVTTALLKQHGIRVFSEEQLAEADDYLASLDGLPAERHNA